MKHSEYQTALIATFVQAQSSLNTAVDAMWASFSQAGKLVEEVEGVEALIEFYLTVPECAARTFALGTLFVRAKVAQAERKAELMAIYGEAALYRSEGFEAMVEHFAKDSFYKGHNAAKYYLQHSKYSV